MPFMSFSHTLKGVAHPYEVLFECQKAQGQPVSKHDGGVIVKQNV